MEKKDGLVDRAMLAAWMRMLGMERYGQLSRAMEATYKRTPCEQCRGGNVFVDVNKLRDGEFGCVKCGEVVVAAKKDPPTLYQVDIDAICNPVEWLEGGRCAPGGDLHRMEVFRVGQPMFEAGEELDVSGLFKPVRPVEQNCANCVHAAKHDLSSYRWCRRFPEAREVCSDYRCGEHEVRV